MSYCRFGDDSDVYAYMSGNGIAVHVANNRVTEGVNIAEVMATADPKDYVKAFNGCYTPITLPYVGEDRCGLTPDAALEFLQELISVGYKVPEYALARLKEEME